MKVIVRVKKGIKQIKLKVMKPISPYLIKGGSNISIQKSSLVSVISRTVLIDSDVLITKACIIG